MSALPYNSLHWPASAAFNAQEARLESMREDALQAVMQVENAAYDWPWKEANIVDSIKCGYQCVTLVGGGGNYSHGKTATDSTLLGYYIAMQGIDEVHLLNITVNPQFQRQGWARVMLDALVLWSCGVNAQWLWLEVRVSNHRALKVYEAYGFQCVGRRKSYYPNGTAAREDAIVMSLKL